MDTTRHIISGLLSVIGGIVDPWLTLQSANNIQSDYTWAIGYHPFGHITQCTRISPLFHDAIIRNHVITSIDYVLSKLNQTEYLISKMARAYVYTEAGSTVSDYEKNIPFWADLLYTKAQLPQIKDELERLEQNIGDVLYNVKRIANFVQKDLFTEAYQHSTSLKTSGDDLLSAVELELSSIEESLLCCYVRHQFFVPMASHRFIAFGFLSVLIFLVARYFLKPKQSGSITQRMQRGARYNQGTVNPRHFL